MLDKNFTYGDLWPGTALPPTENKRVEISVEKLTSNSAFIDYVKESGYRIYLDYGTEGVAFTYPNRREIVLNANYSEEMWESMLQHELGHLMLFNVTQFTTVGEGTLRSFIAEVLYTSNNLSKFGIEKLLYTENVIQDVIIETVTNATCLCGNAYSLYGENIGVKHLESLEDIKSVAREVCSNMLVEPEEEPQIESPQEVRDLLDSMLKDLQDDLDEAEKEYKRREESNDYTDKLSNRRLKETTKAKKDLDRVNEKLKKKSTPGLRNARKKLQETIDQNKSAKANEEDRQEGERLKKRDLERLRKKIDKREELKESLEEERQKAQEAAESGQQPGGQGGKPGQSGQGGAEAGSDAQGNPSQDLDRNETDHLMDTDGETPDNPGHSCDCGFPSPVTITRQESRERGSNLARINSSAGVKTLVLDEESDVNIEGRFSKSSENELTYFKSAKKEIDLTDMMKGKRRKRVSGINVLIGLDISGSMVSEWATRFKEIADLVEDLSVTLDIEGVLYFTYNTKIAETSTDINELNLRARGGNAFGYVYQEILKTLPIQQKNEIILVTDCGDNLGFKLSDAAVAHRNNDEVVNHISIVDTENAGFYSMSNFNKDEWTLNRADDPKLAETIQDNIERLVAL